MASFKTLCFCQLNKITASQTDLSQKLSFLLKQMFQLVDTLISKSVSFEARKIDEIHVKSLYPHKGTVQCLLWLISVIINCFFEMELEKLLLYIVSSEDKKLDICRIARFAHLSHTVLP